jgi:hypothetical protein
MHGNIEDMDLYALFDQIIRTKMDQSEGDPETGFSYINHETEAKVFVTPVLRIVELISSIDSKEEFAGWFEIEVLDEYFSIRDYPSGNQSYLSEEELHGVHAILHASLTEEVLSFETEFGKFAVSKAPAGFMVNHQMIGVTEIFVTEDDSDDLEQIEIEELEEEIEGWCE